MTNKREIDTSNELMKSFKEYAGAVAQSRAFVDVRDGLKPSARQAVYIMHQAGFRHNKPHVKTMQPLGEILKIYIHGDNSLLDLITRLAQPFYTNYPLVEVSGNYGSIIKGTDYAAPRYTSMRLTELSDYLLDGVNEDAIDEWRLGGDDETEYPAVFPTMGYYNLVNGTQGIGVGIASSVPPTNLREVHDAIVKLLHDPDTPFDDIYCAPDMPGGGVIINADDVKLAMKNGGGGSVIMRARMQYVEKDNKIIVTETPYNVYTQTVIGQLIDIVNEEVDEKTGEPKYTNPGIDSFKDFSGDKANIHITLSPGASAAEVMNYLYKNTSLQSYYSINMIMLDKGRYPKKFTWRNTLLAHIDHQIEVYTRVYTFRLNKLKEKSHVYEGFLKLHKNLDAVLDDIRASKNSNDAIATLQSKHDFSEKQAKAIIKRSLGSLTRMDIAKYEDALADMQLEIDKYEGRLASEESLKASIAADYEEHARKFGRDRRTELKNYNSTDIKPIYFTADGKCYRTAPKNNVVVSIGSTNVEEYIAITKQGIVYRMYEIPQRAKKIFSLSEDDSILKVFPAGTGNYLGYISEDNKYRSTSISSLNKYKTTLTISPIKNALLTTDKLKKKEFTDRLK